jgi:hypothetical protein
MKNLPMKKLPDASSEFWSFSAEVLNNWWVNFECRGMGRLGRPVGMEGLLSLFTFCLPAFCCFKVVFVPWFMNSAVKALNRSTQTNQRNKSKHKKRNSKSNASFISFLSVALKVVAVGKKGTCIVFLVDRKGNNIVPPFTACCWSVSLLLLLRT